MKITGGNSVVRGLVINRLLGDGIELGGPTAAVHYVISGNGCGIHKEEQDA